MSTSTITLVGNLTKDPVLRFNSNGVATASFSLAVNRRWTTRATNGPNEAVSYFSVVAWQSLAENAVESLHKGDRVVVTGRLDQRSWVGKDEERRVTYEVVADEIGPSLRWVTADLHKAVRVGSESGASILHTAEDDSPFDPFPSAMLTSAG